jgi:hypothetical protein
MDPQEVQQILFRISEHLRIAINDSNVEEAHLAFEMTTTMLEDAEGFAGRGILTLELIQYLVDLGVEADLSRWSPAANGLINDCLIFGRSDQLFTEVMTTLMGLNSDETSDLIAELIEAAIDATVFSGNVSLNQVVDLWWHEFRSHLVREETLEAVNTFQIDSNDKEDEVLRILTLQIELIFIALNETESILDELSSDRPVLKELLLTCSRNIDINRRMALKSLLSEADSKSTFDALIALTVFFEVQLSDIDNSLELSNLDSPEDYLAMQDLDSKSHFLPNDDVEELVTMLSNGLTVSWTEERNCWVGEDDSEWMVDDQSPHVWIPIEVWRLMYPGKVAKYVRPQPAPPPRPDRQLAQDFHYADHSRRNQVLRLIEKRKYERADSIQLSHFKRTGRWLLGNPPVEGWYPDPLQKFGLRFWTNMNWTEIVSENGRDSFIDEDFPKESD